MFVARWNPSVTVAAIVEDGGRFLLVEEHTSEGLRLNNPAGHLDRGESPLEAVVRETLEETARDFAPHSLLGIYLSRFQRLDVAAPSSAAGPEAAGQPGVEDVTYLRIAYSGSVGAELPGRVYDQPIVRTLWLTADEIRASAARLRSPLVLRCIEDHLAGRRYPLDALTTDASVYTPEIKRRDPPV